MNIVTKWEVFKDSLKTSHSISFFELAIITLFQYLPIHLSKIARCARR